MMEAFLDVSKPADLRKLFSGIRSWDQVNAEPHLAVLNPKFEADVPPETLVPVTFVPPSEWDQDPTFIGGDVSPEGDTPSRLSNGAPAPTHETYHMRRKELQLNNDDAYGAVQHRLRDRRMSMKIVHFRTFFEQLRLAGMYWDTSLDNDLAKSSDNPIRPRSKDSNAIDVDKNDKSKALFSRSGGTNLIFVSSPYNFKSDKAPYRTASNPSPSKAMHDSKH